MATRVPIGIPILLVLMASPGRAAEPPAAAPPRFEPKIEDAMLAPVPRAAREVRTWDEARALLNERSTDLRAAAAGIDRAEGRWRQALSVLLPNARLQGALAYDLLNPDSPSFAAIGAGAAAAGDGDPPSVPTAVASASVTQSVVDLAAWRGLSSAEAGQRGAEATLDDVRRRVTQGLARALVAVVSAERAAEINRLSLRQSLERDALTERIFQLGAGTQLDVVRVRQDVATARGALIAGDELVRRTREALGLALGLPEEVGVPPAFDLDGLPAALREACAPLRAVTERDDVRAAEAQVEVAEESRRQARAGYYPTLGVSSSVVALTTDPGPGRFATWNIAALVSVPLWEGGLRAGLVDERRGIAEQAGQVAEATRRGATVEVERAARQARTAEALLASAVEVRDLARRQDELTRRSFEIGRATSLDLVLSAAVLRQAELSVALREFEWVTARLDAFLTGARCDR